MKIALVLCVLLLSGCAGLNVSWTASYNMPQIAGQVNPSLQDSLPFLRDNMPLLPAIPLILPVAK